MLIKAINRQTHPYFAWPTGTGWRVIDCKADRRTFVSEEYDDKGDALSHIKVLNEAYWLEWEAELETRAVIWKAIEQSTPPHSSRDITLLRILLKAFFRVILFVKKIFDITRSYKSNPPIQPNKNAKECITWKRITLDDIDRIWRKSGKLDAPFKRQY